MVKDGADRDVDFATDTGAGCSRLELGGEKASRAAFRSSMSPEVVDPPLPPWDCGTVIDSAAVRRGGSTGHLASVSKGVSWDASVTASMTCVIDALAPARGWFD